MIVLTVGVIKNIMEDLFKTSIKNLSDGYKNILTSISVNNLKAKLLYKKRKMKKVNSNKQFNDLVKSNKPFVLDFYADWCGPCQSLLPTVEKLAKEFDGEVDILKVNVDENKPLADKFMVKRIPSLFFLKGNKIYQSQNGMMSENEMRKSITELSKN